MSDIEAGKSIPQEIQGHRRPFIEIMPLRTKDRWFVYGLCAGFGSFPLSTAIGTGNLESIGSVGGPLVIAAIEYFIARRNRR